MSRIALFALFVLLGLAGFAVPARAVLITVVWPAGTLGDYSIPGIASKSTMARVSYEVPEGTTTRLVGAGFSRNFSIADGKLTFPVRTDSSDDSTGVHFDPATNTFSFDTVDIHVSKQGYEGDISIDAQGGAVPPDGSCKVVYGVHTLSCPDEIDFSVDRQGVVLLLNSRVGVTARGSTLTIAGVPVEIAPVNNAPWTITPGQPTAAKTGKATVRLVPAEGGYTFKSTTTAAFFLNDDGLLAKKKEGPYHEFITLFDGTTIGMPEGQAKYQARIKQEETDIDLHEKILAASTAATTWKLDFNLVEKLKLCDFPEEELSYPIVLPPNVDPKDLKLLEFTDKWVREVPLQATWIKGSTSPSTIYFRSDLPVGGSRLFRLIEKFEMAGIPSLAPQPPVLQPVTDDANGAMLTNGLLSVKMPAGHHDFAPPKPLNQLPAPILGLARGTASGDWAVTGSFIAPDTLLVASMDASVKVTGPLFSNYEVTYHLANKKNYTVDLELRGGDPELRVAETIDGLKPEDATFLRLDYSKLNPDRRLVPSIGGYHLYGGAYDRDATADGSKAMWPATAPWLNYDPKLDSSPVPQLNFSLGLFMPDDLGVTRAVCFYNETGNDALLIAAYRLRDWQTATREVWNTFRGPENLRFYADGANKFLQANLSGPKRFWAVSLIARDDVVLRAHPGQKVAAGPETWLSSKLNFWSLNAYKDRVVDWTEKLQAAPFDKLTDAQTGKPYQVLAFDDYMSAYLQPSLAWVVNFQDALGGGLGAHDCPSAFGDYALSRAAWTPEQRDQVRQILVTLADYSEGDDLQPDHSMLSGSPNVVMETKAVLPIAAATFTDHPQTKMWTDSFGAFFTEFMDKYDRQDAPQFHTVGGPWTENIAGVLGRDMVSFKNSEEAMKFSSNTSLGKSPQLLVLIHWMRDAMMSPHDGVRMIPPQGAEAQACEPGSAFYNSLFALGQDLTGDDAKLAAELKWMQTSGAQGTKPDIHSAVYTDYGPVFHFDFGGPHESYAHLQNINGTSYGWGHAGVVYYGAKNKVWSYNGHNSDGDNIDWTQVTALTVNGQGLAVGPSDELLCDFDFAQFYRQPGKESDDYHARALMLLRDDYLVVADEMKSPDVTGTFRWVNRYDLPQIYQLKPGAPKVESTYLDNAKPEEKEPPRTFTVRSYTGQGDFLTIVAPAAVTAVSTPFGATVNGEYVFASQKPQDVTEGPALFSGSYGYAQPNQLALFQGTKIGLNGFILQRDAGISARAQ